MQEELGCDVRQDSQYTVQAVDYIANEGVRLAGRADARSLRS